MHRFWVNSSVVYTRTGWSDAPEHHLREWLNEARIFLRWWDTLTMYPSFNGFRDVYIQSSILEKLYNEVHTKGVYS